MSWSTAPMHGFQYTDLILGWLNQYGNGLQTNDLTFKISHTTKDWFFSTLILLNFAGLELTMRQYIKLAIITVLQMEWISSCILTPMVLAMPLFHSHAHAQCLVTNDGCYCCHKNLWTWLDENRPLVMWIRVPSSIWSAEPLAACKEHTQRIL